MIRVWQISLDTLHDEINRLGWTEASRKYPAVDAYLECSHFGAERWQSFFFTNYEQTATIDTDDLDRAFEYGNIGPQEKIIGQLFHSLSVGDILEMEDGTFHMINSIGFAKVAV
jgi:hypothetical protein